MKKKEWIMIAVILGAACIIWLCSNLFMDDAGDIVRITVDQEIYGEYPLDQNQIIKIQDTNICEIKDGEIRMIEADCPDQLCVKTKGVTKHGGTIICLPNRVFIEVIKEDDADLPDAVAS